MHGLYFCSLVEEVESVKPKKNKMVAEGKKYTLDWDDYYSHDVLNEVSKKTKKNLDAISSETTRNLNQI